MLLFISDLFQKIFCIHVLYVIENYTGRYSFIESILYFVEFVCMLHIFLCAFLPLLESNSSTYQHIYQAAEVFQFHKLIKSCIQVIIKQLGFICFHNSITKEVIFWLSRVDWSECNFVLKLYKQEKR